MRKIVLSVAAMLAVTVVPALPVSAGGGSASPVQTCSVSLSADTVYPGQPVSVSITVAPDPASARLVEFLDGEVLNVSGTRLSPGVEVITYEERVELIELLGGGPVTEGVYQAQFFNTEAGLDNPVCGFTLAFTDELPSPVPESTTSTTPPSDEPLTAAPAFTG